MKKESRERILAVGDWAIQNLGFKDWDDGLQFASKVLDAFAEKVRAINTREKVEALLSEMPEPPANELNENVETARKLVFQFRGRLLRFVKDELPHSPGGRPRLLAVGKHAEIRNEIVALIRKGVTVHDAIDRVARQQSVGRRRPVSKRTIERIWQGREHEKG